MNAICIKWLEEIKWNKDKLVPIIVQEIKSNDILMFAWMNREALFKTIQIGEAIYWSRSRNKLWHKGEKSGYLQRVHEVYLDCDEDVILLRVEQVGNIACHTGEHSCFFRKFSGNPKIGKWVKF